MSIFKKKILIFLFLNLFKLKHLNTIFSISASNLVYYAIFVILN